MRKTGRRTPHFALIAGSLLFAATAAHGQMVASSKGRFIFKDANGKSDSAEIVTSYAPRKIVQPVVKANSSINPKLLRAATIAEERANAHSRERCWRYVKEALLSSGAVSSYPQSVNAKDAAKEIQDFRKDAAAEKMDEKRGQISQAVTDAKEKAKEKIDEFKERHTA